ncbi:Probable inactive ATP-dependent zinc metalloprotease FTSHI 1, chloroplastic [Linum grandiflorum]
MTSLDALFTSRIHLPKPYKNSFKCNRNFHYRARPLLHRSFTVLCKVNSSASSSNSQPGRTAGKDDFMTRVLKENPSQIEPRYLIDGELYTSREREDLSKRKDQKNSGVLELLARVLSFKEEKSTDEQTNEDQNGEKDVYLNDILREYKGKLYVPEQVFGAELTEEEEFSRNVEELPKMSLDEFRTAMQTDKVKLLTSREGTVLSRGNVYKDFVVDLKEIPGVKRLHRTKWAMRLTKDETLELLGEYKGPMYEVGRHLTSSVEKLTEFPHPVASSISGRMMVELGVITAFITAAAAVVGGFLASAVFAATSFVFITTVHVVWPVIRPFVNLFLGIVFGIFERFWENVVDVFFDGTISAKLYELYTYGGLSASLQMLKPILLVVLTMVIMVRFTISRRPKNFRKWDLWQGIDFSRSKAEARVDGSTGVKFADVAGIDEAVSELQELVRYLKNPELFDQMCIKPPHGVLLEGPPGCGKTLVAKAIAGEAGVPFYQMAGSEFVEVLVGVGSARIRDLFKRAKVNKPSVIFIDEIDALATRRQGMTKDSKDMVYNAATQERETTLNQLLIELDGFDTGKGVIFLGATNRRDLLDPALLRPGRFDRKIKIRPPNAKGRFEILKIHGSKVKMSETVDLSSYANNLPGWSGAKLAQLVQEAALVAVRQGHTSIIEPDMNEAVDRLTVGPKLKGLDLTHQGQCRRATSEVGVAITAHLLRRYENAQVEFCDRISIVPRGQTLSQLVFYRLDDDDAYMFERRPQLLHRLQVLLGGRAAEEVIYGRDTSKVTVNYLADATWLARKIITVWNLEDPMVIHGEPPAWRRKPKFVGPKLDFEGSLYDSHGMTERPINFDLDDEVAKRTEQLLRDMYGRTISLLKRHHAALLKTIKVLLNHEEINGEAMEYILTNYPPHTRLTLLLEEDNPGSIPLMDEKLERDYALAASSGN